MTRQCTLSRREPLNSAADGCCSRAHWGAKSLTFLDSKAGKEPTMRRTFCMLTTSLTLLTWTFAQPAVAQGEVDPQLGSVHFETSCNEVAQRRFDRAMRYQHSYWYLPAKEIFDEVLKADPTCAMAHWGVALTLLDNPHNAIPQSNLAPGLAAIQMAKALGAKTRARARLHRCPTADVHRLRQAQPCPTHSGVPGSTGEDRGEVSRRR